MERRRTPALGPPRFSRPHRPLAARAALALLAVLAPFACLGAPRVAAAPAASPKKPETTMSEKRLEDLELRYLEWRVEYGEDLPKGVNEHPWRNMGVSVSGGRLNIHLTGGAPSRVWRGAPDRAELDRLKALTDRLLGERGKDWSGRMDRDAFNALSFGAQKQEERKSLCIWKFVAMYDEPDGRRVVREIAFQGADRGDNPGRLAFERPLAEHVEALVTRLHETAPKRPSGLLYFGSGAIYSLDVEDTGQVRVSRRKPGKDEESSEVEPGVVARVSDIARRHKADAWHGFAAPGWDRKRPDAIDCTLHYDTGQDVWVRALRDDAGGASRPPGFPAFERELLAALDTALDGPADARNKGRAAPRQGLKRLDFSQGGMSFDSHITFRVGTRREAGRDVFRLMRRQGNRVTECALSEADLAALEALLVKHKVAKWNGFRGTNKNVLDGDSFGFSLEYADGRTVEASGYMRFPQGYGEARDEIWSFLDGVLEKSGAAETDTPR